MPDKHTRLRSLLAVVLALMVIVALFPFVVIFLVAVEQLTFGTRFFGRGLEATGLTKVLQALFTAIGING